MLIGSFQAELTNFVELRDTWKPPAVQPLDSFPAFYGAWRFITTFTRAPHLCQSWARPIQTKLPIPISTRSILMSSTHLHAGLTSGLFPLWLPYQ
jgi:hypothetical protein